jgi:hypothetical protein
MFFLLPRLSLILIVVFALVMGWRMIRLRHARRRRSRQRWGRGAQLPLVPAAVLQGADRTWVIFTSPGAPSGHDVAEQLRVSEPESRVTEVDARVEPRLAEAFRVDQLPAALLANRYGQVEARLIGLPAIEAYARRLR